LTSSKSTCRALVGRQREKARARDAFVLFVF
jgi:hypothetical protein